ncbi:helix-turn-helix domain-containing protein [Rhizobium tumorigenes]|uniref:Helix-turn-helix domain-containing protein n=1 Tax=Rhizobium tumorigenes TaxID=2041385 RepID=A0AAF1KAC6_9HYPH|nr:helix-turn-helix domain-containing protein [Rhizobium tumorigenes]WFR99373.1 helix-turn-helix domain-containing protein [Rhizobium tumorigenes]
MFSESAHHLSTNVVRMKPGGPSTLSSAFQWRPQEILDAGDALFWEGDKASHIFEVTEGLFRVCKIIADGRRIITGFLFPGDIIGLSFRNLYLYTAEAVTSARVRRCSRLHFQQAISEDAGLQPKLFAKLCEEMAAAQDHMVLLGRKSAEERLCSFFLMLARRHERAAEPRMTVDLPMSRQDIADFLGLTIETVSRNITRLTIAGVISPVGRHSIEVRLNRLSLLAGDCDADNNNTPDDKRRQLANC